MDRLTHQSSVPCARFSSPVVPSMSLKLIISHLTHLLLQDALTSVMYVTTEPIIPAMTSFTLRTQRVRISNDNLIQSPISFNLSQIFQWMWLLQGYCFNLHLYNKLNPSIYSGLALIHLQNHPCIRIPVGPDAADPPVRMNNA